MRRHCLLAAKISLPLVLVVGGCGDMLTYSKDYQRTGEAQLAAGNYDTAAGAFRSAVQQDPRDYKSAYYLGKTYEAMGSPQDAMQAYMSSLSVMDQTLEGKADASFRTQTLDALARTAAKTDRNAATNLALSPNSKRPAEAALLTAKINRYSGDADAAVQSYGQALEQEPRNFAIAKEYGLYLEQLGAAKRADPVLRRAYALNTEDEQVASALRRIGVIPGPSLKNLNDLAAPPIPKGPIPPINLSQFGIGGGNEAAPPPSNDPRYSPASNVGSAEAPRD